MDWLILIVAGVLETVWAVGLKSTQGFTRPGPTVVVVPAMILSVVLLAWAMKTIPVSIAYPVWTAIGAAGAVLVGVIWLSEPMNAMRALCLTAIIGGTLGLKFSSGH